MFSNLRNTLIAVILFIGFVVSSAIALNFYLANTKLTKEVATLKKYNYSLKTELDTLEITNRLQTETLNRDIDKLKIEITNANLKMQRHLATTALATNGLLDTIKTLNAQSGRDTGRVDTDTLRADATRARNLLGQCAKEYERMGAEAERLKVKVTDLQSVITLLKP